MRSALLIAIVIPRNLGGSVDKVGRVKRVELLVSVGAGVLGAGIGALFSSVLGSTGMALVAVGAAMHAVGMWHRHRLDLAADAALPTWASVSYWGCWVVLALLAGYTLLR